MSHRRLALAGLALALLAPATAQATTAPTVQLPNTQITEGDSGGSPLTLAMTLDRPNPYPHPVSVIVGDFTPRVVRGSNPPRTYGTATPGADYGAITQFRLEWAPGQQVATFPVTLRGDVLAEADENINIRISGPAGGVLIADNDADVVLRDNDPPGPWAAPVIALPNTRISEPDVACVPYPVTLHLSRPNLTAAPISVGVHDFTTIPVPNSSPPRTYGTATPGVDYVAFAPFRLAFAPGASAATFPIEICGDTLPEPDEEIDVRVAAPAGISIRDNDLDLILRNDDS